MGMLKLTDMWKELQIRLAASDLLGPGDRVVKALEEQGMRFEYTLPPIMHPGGSVHVHRRVFLADGTEVYGNPEALKTYRKMAQEAARKIYGPT